MELGAIFVGLAMLVATVPFLVKPFRKRQQHAFANPFQSINPEEQRLAALSALRDLDFDFQLGKVSQEDYEDLRAHLVAEAAQYIQTQEEADEQLEALIRARKASQKQSPTCASCGQALAAGSRFCPRCGAPALSACPACGGDVQANDTFCTACGAELGAASEVSA